MPCQLMVGFFAYAKSLDIKVDKAELEGILTNVHIICIIMSPLLVFFLRQLLLKFSFTLNGSELVETLCTDAQWHTREDVKKALDTAFKKVQKRLSVPGFRKGKVPRQIFNNVSFVFTG